MKDTNDNAIFEKQAQEIRWTEHFERLLNRPPPENTPNIKAAEEGLTIDCDPLSYGEVVNAIKQLNRGKVAGPDLQPSEALKADDHSTASILHPLFSKVGTKGKFPRD